MHPSGTAPGQGTSQQGGLTSISPSHADDDDTPLEERDNSVVNHCLVVNDTESAIEPQAQPERDGAQRCEFDSTSVHRQTPPTWRREIPGQHFIHPDRAAQLRRPRDGNETS